jgi:hypothetical protein
MEVDLVDQVPLEELPTDRGREDLEVLAVSGLQADPHRLGHATAQEGDSFSPNSSTKPGRKDAPLIEVHSVARSGHEAIDGHREVPEHLSGCGLASRISHGHSLVEREWLSAQ